MTTSFKESGLLLDISRRAYPPEAIKAFISYIKAAGGRYLQLHFSDDENYAVESELLGQQPAKGSPEENGLYLNPVTGKYFLSKAQLAEIVTHAAAEGIELIPELGSPGHMSGIFALYGAKYGVDALDNGFKNAYSELRYTTPAAIEFVQNLYAEVIGMFPGIKRFHIGGDEHGAAYNELYNLEFVEYANKQAAFLKARGLIPRMWNDGVMVSTLSELDKSIEITFWAWDGDKPTERERLTSIRAGMDEIVKAGFKVYNCNSYYTYSVPRGADRISGDANYAAVDGYANWDLSKWDGNRAIPDTRKVNPRDVAGSAMSIWSELLDSSQTWQEILEALKPHISAVFYLTDLQNLKDDNMTRMFTRRQKPTENIVPSAIYATGDTTGVTLHIADKEGTKLIPVSGLSEEDLQTVQGAKNDAQTAAQAAAQAKADADKQAAAAAAAKAAADEAKVTAQQQAQSAQQQAATAVQAKTESAAILEQVRQAQNNSGALTAEQKAALERFSSAVGTGANVDVENITDVPALTVGSGVTRLRIRSYTGNSGLGGGEFVKVANTTAADLGMVLKTKDGMTFQRDLSVDDFITPYMFGYTDGLADATNFYQTVLTEAAKYKCRIRLPRNGTMPLNKQTWSIPAGIKEIDGNNCTLVHTFSGNSETYLADAIDGIHIHHVNIRYSDTAGRCGGFFATGAKNVEISYCDIKTKQNHGILNRIRRKSGKSVTGWEVHHNTIDVDRGINYQDSNIYTSSNGAYICILFDMDTILDGAASNSMDVMWKSLKTVPDAEGVRHRNHRIHNNNVTRGRYGIGVYFIEDSYIYDNTIVDVVRGISMQDRSWNNHIHHNNITNYTTGILNNYMCANNVIENNILKRTADWYYTGTGQAHIAAWVQPKGIVVKNNRCEAWSNGGPSWGIAFGINAENNIAEGNVIVGKINRCVFNTESSWSRDTTVGYNLADPEWASTDTKNNSFIGNYIDVSSPCVLMAAISNTDNGTVRKNVGTVFKNNIIKGSSAAAKAMFQTLEQTPGGITDLVVEGNTYQVDAAASKFSMGNVNMYKLLMPEVGRPSVGFETSMGGGGSVPADLEARLKALSNLVMGVSVSIDLSGDGVLGIGSSSNSYALRNLAADNTNRTLKSITGGEYGREVIVQFQTGYQIEHSDVLRLTGAVSVTSGINGNTFKRFKCIDAANNKWAQI